MSPTFRVPQFFYQPFVIEETINFQKYDIKEVLKSIGINFADEPITNNINECMTIFGHHNSHFPVLSDDNLYFYNQMKLNSLKGVYPGLTLVKDLSDNYFVKTSAEIKNGTLLFEVWGNVVTIQYLIENKNVLCDENHKIYFYFRGSNFNKNKNLLLWKNGNIAFFVKYGNKNKSNLQIKSFMNENGKVVVLAISSKVIPSNNYLFTDKIFKNLYY